MLIFINWKSTHTNEVFEVSKKTAVKMKIIHFTAFSLPDDA